MTAPLLTLAGLHCSRGGVPVLEDVSLTLHPGEAAVVKGPNGSGKTTLLRTIAGLQPATRGGMVRDGDSIAYVPHANGVKGTLSVAENLAFWAGLHGAGGVDAALDAFALGALRNRRVQTLSAGQKRRLALARLLVTGRPFWLLDEPTDSLDEASVRLFADLARAHLASGGVALIASHADLGLDAQVLDVASHRPTGADARFGDEAFL
ncbi:MAG: heme ABC exporter ATP-binding protein CcmA [Boseongicola sp. SB0676_bin_33]|uniref:Heme ABC exporter ATP-binding protein CcmA n=1 Tax=Boseongicola sp. SB0664_bin_43 TaxID=2604844 RepID=A0A6B0Y0R5_9RHOB|nr:heme ABC exporter ATP-binding protein CcmA [Boseongicola sp. SB0664_bin_43]MYF89824.1 heme ABC exporter ATP-binding protein CcmA [Boseongicola sp. SB0676_bin_33]MYK33044.1 heme ABC exporter ATP-binding protein CcmA [Boseongicola sp. SB0670_bin_30]